MQHLEGKYKTLYIDPPWSETGGGKIKRGADKHYQLMKTPDIITLLKRELIGHIEPNAHLYLWVTNNFMRDGHKVMDALGFNYKTMITWFKVSEDGKGNIGLGQYFRGVTEHCLFGVKGVLPYKVIHETGKRMQGRTGFYAKKGEHSAKPIEMRKMIETVSYPRYLEMFGRVEVDGWDVWGNEVREQECNNLFAGGWAL